MIGSWIQTIIEDGLGHSGRQLVIFDPAVHR
jgi:hypothetical protein